VLKLTSQDALIVTLLVAVTNFIWNPVGGRACRTGSGASRCC